MTINDIEFELHTHTIASTHAYATVTEMAKAASEKGLKAMGITDHGPGLQDAPHLVHFQNMNILPQTLFGVEMLYGAELNIKNYSGDIDMDIEDVKRLAVRLVGMHHPIYVSGTIEQNTEAIVAAVRNPYMDCIVHPDDSNFQIDYEKFVKAAKETDILIEVNNNSLRAEWKANVRENILTYLKLCKKYDNKIILASDAHYTTDIKNLRNCIDIVEEVGINPKNIMNYNYEAFKEYISHRRSLSKG